MDEDATVFRRGIRAEPKYLRTPTSFESISSGLSWLSVYVSSGMQKIHHPDTTQHCPSSTQHSRVISATAGDIADDDEEGGDEKSNHSAHDEPVTFAMFQEMNDKISGQYLLLGYSDGFQLWDVSNPENVHETCSIRDDTQLGAVKFMHILASPQNEDHFLNERPLLAVVANLPGSSTDSINPHSSSKESLATVLHIYSLRTHRIIKSFYCFAELGEYVSGVQSNGRFVTLGCIAGTAKTISEKQHQPIAVIRILGSGSLAEICAPLNNDVFCQPGTSPVFALGSRYLAYATSAELSTIQAEPFLASVINSNKDMMKEAAKDIANEVVSGVRYLSSYGYRSLSNYLSNDSARVDERTLLHRRGTTTGNPETRTNNKPMLPAAGMVMIRDLLVITAPEMTDCAGKTRTKTTPSVYAHFRPYKHPITSLVFNSAGTLLLSASNQGHTFQVYSLVEKDGLALVYKLARGITDALVSDVLFSSDSLWCAVSTVKGTTHLFAINPYGGQPDVCDHVHSRVTNRKRNSFGTGKKNQAVSLGPVVRIKQRRPMPNLTEENSTTIPERSAAPTFLCPISNSNNTSRANLTALFLPPTKVPSLGGQCRQPAATTAAKIYSSYTGLSSSLPWWRKHSNQLTSMLPAFATGQQENPDDSRLFGFEEEENKGDQPVSIGHRDIYSIHPGGILTLHRSWATQVLVKKHDQGRVIEKYYEMRVKANDIAEWKVVRQRGWAEVKEPLDVVDKHKKSTKNAINATTINDGSNADNPTLKLIATKNNKKGWLAFAEIATYHPEYDLPIWQAPHISMHTFDEDRPDLEQQMREGIVPSATQIVFKREVPEPYNSRIDRVDKTNAAVHSGSLPGTVDDEHLDDALLELEENLTSAMAISFLPSSKKTHFGTSLSPPVLIHFSPKSPTSLENITTDDTSKVSFEDAYHVHLGSGGWQYRKQCNVTPFSALVDHGGLVPEEGEEWEEGMGELLFSPDGDNEVDSPYDSVFGSPEFSSSR